MSLEYLVRMPTRIGTIGALFENNGVDLFLFLEVTKEDKQAFRLLGLDTDKLPLVEKDISDEWTGVTVDTPSQIEFYDLINRRMETKGSSESLADTVIDAYSSLASLNISIIQEYKTKIQELKNQLNKAAKLSKTRNYLFYVGVVGGGALAVYGYYFHPSTVQIASTLGVIMVVGATIYDRVCSWRANAADKQKMDTIDQYIGELVQQEEAYHNAATKLMMLKGSLLGTGWFPREYGI